MHFKVRPMIHFGLIFMESIGRVYVYTNAFVCGCPVVLALSVGDAALSPSNCAYSFVKDRSTIFTWVYFWALYSAPLVYLSLLAQHHTVLIIVAL